MNAMVQGLIHVTIAGPSVGRKSHTASRFYRFNLKPGRAALTKGTRLHGRTHLKFGHWVDNKPHHAHGRLH